MNPNRFRIGQRVRNNRNGWYGQVFAVECLVCGADVNDGYKCGHSSGYFITVGQLITATGEWNLKPWCCTKDYTPEEERRTFWERLAD